MDTKTLGEALSCAETFCECEPDGAGPWEWMAILALGRLLDQFAEAAQREPSAETYARLRSLADEADAIRNAQARYEASLAVEPV